MNIEIIKRLILSTIVNLISLIAFIVAATLIGDCFNYDIKNALISESLGNTVHAAGLLIAFLSLLIIYIIGLYENQYRTACERHIGILKTFFINSFGYSYALPIAFIYKPFSTLENHDIELWIATISVIAVIPLVHFGALGAMRSWTRIQNLRG